MNFKTYKNNLPFILTIFCFFLSIGYLLTIYFHWDDTISTKKSPVEINLPVIQWEYYMNLSKKYKNDTN